MIEKSTQLLGVGSRVRHASFGEGVVIRLYPAAYDVCFMLYGIKSVGKDHDRWEIIEVIETTESVTFSEAEKSLMRILRAWSDVSEVVPLGDRWEGGTMILKPKDSSQKPKEVPIEQFFHKIEIGRASWRERVCLAV